MDSPWVNVLQKTTMANHHLSEILLSLEAHHALYHLELRINRGGGATGSDDENAFCFVVGASGS
jgi:hypothetical protein